MNKLQSFWLGFAAGLLIVVTIFLIWGNNSVWAINGREEGYKQGYKYGQIDALTGTIKYELIKWHDSTWTKTKD